jgi:hypothetical protein
MAATNTTKPKSGLSTGKKESVILPIVFPATKVRRKERGKARMIRGGVGRVPLFKYLEILILDIMYQLPFYL